MSKVADFNAVAQANRRKQAVKLYTENVSVPEIGQRLGMSSAEVQRAVKTEVNRLGKERGAYGEAARDRYFMELDAVSRALWGEWERQREEVTETRQSLTEEAPGPKGEKGKGSKTSEVRKRRLKADAALMAGITRNVEIKLRVLGFIQPAKVFVNTPPGGGGGGDTNVLVVLGGFDIDPDSLGQIPATPNAAPPLLPDGIVLDVEASPAP